MDFQRLCRCINNWIWLSNGRTWAHTQSTGLQKMYAMHTHSSVLWNAQVPRNTDTQSQPGTHPQKEVRWAERHTCAQEKKTHLNWWFDRLERTYMPCLMHKGILNSVTEDSLPRLPTLTDIQVSKSFHLKQALLVPETALFQATLPSDLEASQP